MDRDADTAHGFEMDAVESVKGRNGDAGDHIDLDFDGLTVYEKKAALINRELDGFGMGRYQWWIWSLCGFGYARRAMARL